ncbi:MAG: hypothetical protein LBQ19_01755 [Synergistaceae bacterium]|jgi:curli biogenesis system outer membrane secretion channel CsgG/TolA-binding protein|nr:hypothetical protein [Synergistaceae bacterium]
MKISWKVIFLTLFLCALVVPADAANDKIRIGILKFGSKADGVQDRQAEIITDIFTRALYGSKTVSIYERERFEDVGAEIRVGLSGLVDPMTAAEVGRIKGLQYMVLGAVTELNQKADGVIIPLGGIGIGSGSHEAKARIEMRVIDVATSEICLALTEVGTSKNSAQALSFGGVAWAEGEFGGLEARAINDAAIRLANKIRVELGGEYSYVISGSGSEFIIDQGEANGVENGALFLVYAEGSTVRGMNGEVLGRDKIPLAVLKVKSAESAHSVCTVAPPTKGNLIKRGDKVEPISAEEARKIKPVSSRPAVSASSETFDQIFKEDSSPSSPGSPEREPQAGEEVLERPAEPRSTQPAVARQPAGYYQMKEVEGIDPNSTTDAKLIDAYVFIEPTERNTLGIQHRGAWQMYSGKRYKDAFEIFTKLTDDYPGNYLSAYWAGMCAIKLGSDKEAAKWFDLALAFNPNYQPAIDARAKIGEDPANKPAKKKKK